LSAGNIPQKPIGRMKLLDWILHRLKQNLSTGILSVLVKKQEIKVYIEFSVNGFFGNRDDKKSILYKKKSFN